MAEYTIEYLDRGGDRLALHVYPAPPAGPAALILPAMGVPARYYRTLAGHLTAAGVAVVVADLRGTGDSTPRPDRRSRYGYAELVDDVTAVREAVRTRFAGRTTLLVGHSLGGQLSLLHLAREGPTVDGVVLVATGLPYVRSYPRRLIPRVLWLTQSTVAVAALLRVWPGWGFGGRQARGVIRDWGYTSRHGRFPRLAGWDAESALRSVRTPVLAITVDGDYYTPPATTRQLTGKVPAAPVTTERYTVEAAGVPVDHFRWVRASAALATRIAGFAAELTADRATGRPGSPGPVPPTGSAPARPHPSRSPGRRGPARP